MGFNISSCILSRVLVQSVSRLRLDHTSHEILGRQSSQGPEKCHHSRKFSDNLDLRRSSPVPSRAMALFRVWFIATILLTSTNCFQTVEAQPVSPDQGQSPGAASLPFQSGEVTSLPFQSSEPASLPFQSGEVTSLPFQSSEPASLPFQSAGAVGLQSQSPEAAPLQSQSPEAATLPFQSPEATILQSQSPEAASLQSHSPEAAALQFQGPEAATLQSQSPEAASLQFQNPVAASLQFQSPDAASPQSQSPEAVILQLSQSPEAGSPVILRPNSPGLDILREELNSLRDGSPPAVFVFGDSLVDTGNNNFIRTLAKANMLFNGIDFPEGPTGRFCNGRTTIDIICDILGVPYPPAFLDPETNGSKIFRGVNYASAAGGILDATGENFLGRVCMNQQIGYFQETTLPQLEAQLGKNETSTLLASSLVAVVIGSNDYINNYLLIDTNSQSQYNPAQFDILVINSFSRQLTELYSLGFRMFYVSGIGPIGCIPHQLAISGQPTCVSSVNAQIQDFNVMAGSLLQDLTTALPDSMFLFGNAYGALTDIINNPGNYGFTIVNQGCCGGGLYRALALCQPTAAVCIDRDNFVFWDSYHPTEASNLIVANGMYRGGTNVVTPMNIQQLLAQRLPRRSLLFNGLFNSEPAASSPSS